MNISLFWAHLMTPTALGIPPVTLDGFCYWPSRCHRDVCHLQLRKVSFRTLITQQAEKEKHNSSMASFVAATQLSDVKVSANSN